MFRYWVGLALCLSLCACEYFEAASTDLNIYRKSHANVPYPVAMLFGDFGGLSTDTLQTNAYPLKLAVAALVMEANKKRHLPIAMKTYFKVMREFGFYIPNHVANLESDSDQPQFQYPAGIVRGMLEFGQPFTQRVEVGNITCGTCHGGRMYNADGTVSSAMWFGSPNTSMNIEGYSTALYRAFKATVGHENEALSIVKQLYPQIDNIEYQTIQGIIFAQLAVMMKNYEDNGDDILGYYGGPPGNANGIGSFKRILGLIPHYGKDPSEVGYVSIPDMAYRRLKTNLTIDGTYTVPGETPFTPLAIGRESHDHFQGLGLVASLFPITVQGVQVAAAENHIPDVSPVAADFFANYRPPVFPGVIDTGRASSGEVIFQKSCQSCHGQYEAYAPGQKQLALLSYPNKLVPIAQIGTDSERLKSVTPELKSALLATWIGQKIELNDTKGYMPPVLSGLWATAPYLHNGSVPTLWHLMHPGQRPAKFFVGGHKLDFSQVGIAGQYDAKDQTYKYPAGYKPWSNPVLVDTAMPGQGHQGHERMFDGLSDADKTNLIEYLKLL